MLILLRSADIASGGFIMEYPTVQSAGDHTMRYSATYLRLRYEHVRPIAFKDKG